MVVLNALEESPTRTSLEIEVPGMQLDRRCGSGDRAPGDEALSGRIARVTAQTLDGKAILATIKEELRGRVATLAQQGITPGLGTVLVGNDPGSTWYEDSYSDLFDAGLVQQKGPLPQPTQRGFFSRAWNSIF